jgi:hypothetical protein
VTVRLQGKVPVVPAELHRPRLTFAFRGAPPLAVPRLGLGLASHDEPPSQRELSRLRALNLAHLRVDLRLDEPKYAVRLRNAHACGQALGVPLEVALFLTDDSAALENLVEILQEIKPRIYTWLLFHVRHKVTPESWIRTGSAAVKRYAPAARVGAGTDADFVALNRQPVPTALLDLACYSMNP